MNRSVKKGHVTACCPINWALNSQSRPLKKNAIKQTDILGPNTDKTSTQEISRRLEPDRLVPDLSSQRLNGLAGKIVGSRNRF
jgi:hypothetical protein